MLPLKKEDHPTEQPIIPFKHRVEEIKNFFWHDIEDKNSRATNLLAAERTYLAYFRTAIALMVIGITVASLLRSQASLDGVKVYYTIIGTICVVFGFLIVLFSTCKFYVLKWKLLHGTILNDNLSFVGFVLFSVLLTALCLVLIFL